MRANFIEVPAPGFDHDLCLCTGQKTLHAEAFVSQLAIEALQHPVLPLLTGIDQGGPDAKGFFSRAFSCSSCFWRHTSSSWNDPNRFFQL